MWPVSFVISSGASLWPRGHALSIWYATFATIAAHGRPLIVLYVCICFHSSETHAPIAKPPNSAQLEGTPYHSAKLHLGACSSVGIWCWDRHTHSRGQYIFHLALPNAKCSKDCYIWHGHIKLSVVSVILCRFLVLYPFFSQSH